MGHKRCTAAVPWVEEVAGEEERPAKVASRCRATRTRIRPSFVGSGGCFPIESPLGGRGGGSRSTCRPSKRRSRGVRTTECSEERVKSLIVSNKELLEENNKLREALKRANGSTFSPPPAPKDAKESPSASSPPKDAKTETTPPPAAKKEPAQQQQQQQQNEGENASPNANVKQE